jgi:hypothetical protein
MLLRRVAQHFRTQILLLSCPCYVQDILVFDDPHLEFRTCVWDIHVNPERNLWLHFDYLSFTVDDCEAEYVTVRTVSVLTPLSSIQRNFHSGTIWRSFSSPISRRFQLSRIYKKTLFTPIPAYCLRTLTCNIYFTCDAEYHLWNVSLTCIHKPSIHIANTCSLRKRCGLYNILILNVIGIQKILVVLISWQFVERFARWIELVSHEVDLGVLSDFK